MKNLKPLTWLKNWSLYNDGWTAYTAVGRYDIGCYIPSVKPLIRNYICVTADPREMAEVPCASLEDAKQKCWQHYQKKVFDLFED